MSDEYIVQTWERVTKRLKKGDLAAYGARMEIEADRRVNSARLRVTTLEDKVEALQDEVESLRTVRDAIAAVLTRRGARLDNPDQLSLLLQTADAIESSEEGKNTPEGVLLTLLDACDTVVAEVGGGDGALSYDELRDALDVALSDRAALLKRAGLTDREWSALGGACEANF